MRFFCLTISGDRGYEHPLTLPRFTCPVRQSSPVELTGKPLPGLSWLSYSSPTFFGRSPSAARHPVPSCCQPENSPRQPGRTNLDGTCTRVAAMRLWSFPPGRDSHPLCTTSALTARGSRSVPVARPRPGDWVEVWNCPLTYNVRRFYAKRPPSNWTSTSPCIQLYESAP